VATYVKSETQSLFGAGALNWRFTRSSGRYGSESWRADWSLLPIPSMPHMPAAKWELENICRLRQFNPRRHADLLARWDEKLQM
jgi:hypothetical protein